MDAPLPRRPCVFCVALVRLVLSSVAVTTWRCFSTRVTWRLCCSLTLKIKPAREGPIKIESSWHGVRSKLDLKQRIPGPLHFLHAEERSRQLLLLPKGEERGDRIGGCHFLL